MGKHAPAPPITTVLGPCRIDLAIKALEEGIQVDKFDARTWRVTSGTYGTIGYAVLRDPGDLHYLCGCPAGQHGIDCKHVALVMLVEATGAVPPILPTPPERGY